MDVDQVTDPVAYHGEGPVWSSRWGGLRWVDMLAGDILSLDEAGTVGRRHVGSVAAAVRPRRGGGAVIAVERGFALEDLDGSVAALPEIWSSTQIRMNEGGCDPDGRFYCGSMAYDQRPGAASVYRLDPDLTVTVVLSDVTISNGLEWSPDGSRAYSNDTATHRIDVFDYDSRAGLSNRRTFAEVPDGGWPDGLTVDVEGGVWTAIANGGAVQRYRPDGVLDEVIEVPARMVTACTFGGEHLDQLFITTSREGLTETRTPSPARCSGRRRGSPAGRSGSSPGDRPTAGPGATGHGATAWSRCRSTPSDHAGRDVLLTVGHGTASQEELVRLLTDADVEAVVDVRRFPGSRRHPHAARDAMARWLPEAGVGYRWDERLGGRRRPAEGSPHTGLRHPSFRAYADHMDTAEFATAVGELLEQLTEQRSVILCSESLWWRCHRRLIADHVTAVHGVDVRHLFHDGRLAHHRMTDVTRVEGDALVYDGGEPTLDLGDA